MQELIEEIHQALLPGAQVESVQPYDPVVVHQLPFPWQLLGTGNYAAVVTHPDYPEVVVKIYAPGRPGHLEEVKVYRHLGQHHSYSHCFHAEANYLILKRLHGVTLYDCLHQGIKIPPQVIQDIDDALAYARSKGLNPHDVHGKNLMMQGNNGLVVDVSDFLKPEMCHAWQDLKRAYYILYRPLSSRLPLRLPYAILDGIRGAYRIYRQMTKRL